MLKIESTEKYSIAEELKLKGGDTLLKINGREVADILDYIYFDAFEELDITVQKAGGKTVVYEIEKDPDEPLGIVFGESAEIDTESCCNSCLFCFVDQLPKGLRKTLYVKDDDYRLSFISGNYVTLTNICEKEIKRIIEQKISPLYISVHAADTALRRKMLGNENAQDIIAILKRLSAAGIVTHCQIVLCGGLNDGSALESTVKKLYELYPAVNSLAVVPVGLTAHRGGLFPLSPLSREQAAAAVRFCEDFNKSARAEFAFCSDEMYHIAGKELPPHEHYGEFLQIENGVGLIRKFEREFLDALEDAHANAKKPREICLVTGISAAGFLENLVKSFNEKYPDTKISVLPVKNDFFGHSVTVAGLVTGGDILRSLAGLGTRPDKIIVPKCMLKEFSTLFLDNSEFGEIEKTTGVKTEICTMDGAALLEKLLK